MGEIKTDLFPARLRAARERELASRESAKKEYEKIFGGSSERLDGPLPDSFESGEDVE